MLDDITQIATQQNPSLYFFFCQHPWKMQCVQVHWLFDVMFCTNDDDDDDDD